MGYSFGRDIMIYIFLDDAVRLLKGFREPFIPIMKKMHSVKCKVYSFHLMAE